MKLATFGKISFLRQKVQRLLETRYRLLIPLLVIVLTKIIIAIYLFNMLNMGSTNTYWMAEPKYDLGQNTIFTMLANQGTRVPFLFLGWDSAWYLSISAKGYLFSDQSFTFFPGLPLLTWLLNMILQNPANAIVAICLVSGLFWIPVFQLVAEQYMTRATAFVVTFFYASFPYVFLFTTVAYSEGVFLFSTLLAWYFFKKEKLASSSISAALATLLRVPGLLLLLPMLIEHLRKRPHPANFKFKRNIFYFSLPFQAFFSWVLYSRVLSGEWFAFGTRMAWTGMLPFSILMFGVLPKSGIQGFLDHILIQVPFTIAWIPFILVMPVFIYAVIKMEKSLAVYSAIYVFVVLIGGAVYSIPRFLSFCFPLWLAGGLMFFRNRRAKLVFPLIFVLSSIISVYLWQNFLNGLFIA